MKTKTESRKPIPSRIKDEGILAARRAHLVSVSTNLFIERGFTAVSVSEIAEASGMSIGSIYKYIRTKEDLLWLVMDSIYSRLEHLLIADRHKAQAPADAFQLSFQRFLYSVDGVRRGLLLMYRAYAHLPREGQREFMLREERLADVFVNIVKEGNARGVFHCPSPKLAALNMLQSGHALALKDWMLGGIGLEEFVRRQIALAFAMVRSDVAPGDKGTIDPAELEAAFTEEVDVAPWSVPLQRRQVNWRPLEPL